MIISNEDEQSKLKADVAELTAYIETSEQKSADATAFISVVRKYEHNNRTLVLKWVAPMFINTALEEEMPAVITKIES